MNRSNLIRLFGLLACIATVAPAVDAEAAHCRHRRRCCEPVCCQPVCCETVRYEPVCCEPVRCAPVCETVCAPACASATVTYVDNGCRTCCSTGGSRIVWQETVVVPTVTCCASTSGTAAVDGIAATPSGTKVLAASFSR